MSDQPDRLRPVPTWASKPQIHALAGRVAERLGFKPGDSLAPLVSRLGGEIVYDDPRHTEAGAPESMIVYGVGRFTIFIPSTTSHRRDRFTIAHELGHYFLHFPLVQRQSPGATMIATRWVDEAETNQQRAEWEANWFAAGFLMPERIFTERWREVNGSVIEVASFFDLSASAVEVRAKGLHLS